MNATVYDWQAEQQKRLTARANDYQRIAERYAAELIDKLGAPSTYDLAVQMISVAYLEGGMAQLTWARDKVIGND